MLDIGKGLVNVFYSVLGEISGLMVGFLERKGREKIRNYRGNFRYVIFVRIFGNCRRFGLVVVYSFRGKWFLCF